MSKPEQPFFDLLAPDTFVDSELIDMFSSSEYSENELQPDSRIECSESPLKNIYSSDKQTESSISTSSDTNGTQEVKHCIKKGTLSASDQRRAVIGWLAKQSPNGIGISVPTRISKYKADVAAFWSKVQNKLLTPSKTVIVEIRNDRKSCWPDNALSSKLLEQLASYKKLRAELQQHIRDTEPQLQDLDTLFEEFQIWNYKESKNEEYHKCIEQIQIIEDVIYKGTKFQQLTNSNVADHLYLAVPTGEITTEEIADHWGLLYINDDMSVDLIQEAESLSCPINNQLHLVQNIAKSTYNSLLFSLGIQQQKQSEVTYRPIPRKRRIKRNH